MSKKKKVRITIHSALIFEIDNFGDELLKELLENKIYEIYPNAEISYLSLDNFFKDLIKSIISSDIFIYSPGGYLGYIEKWFSGTAKKTWERFFYYYLPGLIYTFAGKPLVLFGQGIGPYEYFFLKPILGRIAMKSSLITVRDCYSKKLLLESGVKEEKIHLTSDCSQIIIKRGLVKSTEYSEMIRYKLKEKKKIFILVFEACEWFHKVVDAMREYIIDDNYAFVIGGDSNVARGIECLKNFSAPFPKKRTFTYVYKNPIQLLSIINECDVVLTPKFHTAIVASVLGKSVFAFSVQYAKTRIFFNDIGYSNRVYNLFDMDGSDMLRIINKYIDVPIVVPESNIIKSDENYKLLESFLLLEDKG